MKQSVPSLPAISFEKLNACLQLGSYTSACAKRSIAYPVFLLLIEGFGKLSSINFLFLA